MKTIYFALLFSACCSLAKAQPIITQANFPTSGNSFPAKLKSVSWTPGPSGINQSWDFSNVTDFGDVTFEYKTPSSTIYSSNFPNANISVNVYGQSTFFLSTSTEYFIYGTVTGLATSTIRPYTDPQKIVTFPFTYDNEVIDNAKTSNYPDGSGGNYQFRSTKSKTKADGYGNITVPGSIVYNNVLRLRITAETIDSNFTSSNVFIDRDIYIDTNYYWISPELKPHVFVLSKSSNELGENAIIVAQYFTTPAVVAGDMEAYSSYFNLYPNPLSNELYIEVDEHLFNSKENLKFTLLNNKGAEVMSSPINTNKIILQKDNLSSGLYYYKITSKQVILSTGKLSVQ
jgi:hypothetical protein